MLDTIIRHQTLVIGSLGAFITFALLLTARLKSTWVQRLEAMVPRGLRDYVPVRIAVPALIAVLMAALAATRPIPRTLGLVAGELDSLRSSTFTTPRYLIVFLHGWNGDTSATWRRFPNLVGQDDRFRLYKVVSLPYPTYMARRNLRVSELAHWLGNELQRAGADRFEAVFFVAHSMGGVVAREIVLQHRLAAAPIPYRQLIEIGVPHDGANLAALAAALGLSRELTRDIVKDSGFLTGLRQHWNQLSRRPETFCITSPHDAIVDERSAVAQCDREFRYLNWGHSELVKPDDRSDPRYEIPMSRLANRN